MSEPLSRTPDRYTTSVGVEPEGDDQRSTLPILMGLGAAVILGLYYVAGREAATTLTDED